jgi:hypothetical protein
MLLKNDKLQGKEGCSDPQVVVVVVVWWLVSARLRERERRKDAGSLSRATKCTDAICLFAAGQKPVAAAWLLLLLADGASSKRGESTSKTPVMVRLQGQLVGILPGDGGGKTKNKNNNGPWPNTHSTNTGSLPSNDYICGLLLMFIYSKKPLVRDLSHSLES